MKDKPPFNRPRKVTLTEWKIVKNYTSSRIQGFICQDNKITFSNNILHEFFRVEWSFKIYEHLRTVFYTPKSLILKTWQLNTNEKIVDFF